jgi:hypothetical protein
MLITDPGADPEVVEQIRQAGVEVKIAQKRHTSERAVLQKR